MIFTEILDQHNIPYATEGHRHCRPGWVQIDCPFCGPGSGHMHMGYNINAYYTNCWKCGSHRIEETLSALLNIPWQKSKTLLKEITGPYTVPTERPRGTLVYPKGVDHLQYGHKQYLRQRGFNPTELWVLWKLQGIGIATKLIWRIFIPIYFRGEVVSWTTRSIQKHDDTIRYISAKPEEESMPARNLLFGEDYARHAIIICEGPFDVFRIGPGAVATLGTMYSNAQVQRMSKYPCRVVCFDSESEAQKRARKLADTLAGFPGETHVVTLESAKDAGAASVEEIQELRKRFL